MAIVFDPARARVDVNYRNEAINLYKQGNLKIDEQDLNWLINNTSSVKDSTTYDIELGKTEKLETTDTENDNKPSRSNKSGKTNAIVDLSVTAGAMGASTAIGLSAASGMSGWQAQMAGCNSMATEIACLTAFAVGTKYMISQPNKDERNELMDLKEAMETGNLEVANAALGVENANESIENISEETGEIEKSLNKDIEAKIKELEEKEKRLNELQEKSKTEEGLTEEEQAELDSLPGDIEVLKSEISDLKESVGNNIDENTENIESEEDTIEEANNVFENMSEVAEYAEGYDETTQSAATIQAIAQGANAAMGFGAAAALTFHSSLLSLTGYGQIIRGLALAGAGMSTIGTIEQINIASDVSKEIDVRTDLQSDIEEAGEQADETTENIDNTLELTKSVSEDLENISVKETEDDGLTSSDTTVKPDNKEDDKKEPKEDDK